MLCPVCNTEMMIDRTEFAVTGDQSAQTETKLYHVPFFKCKNMNCTELEKEKRGEPIALALSKI